MAQKMSAMNEPGLFNLFGSVTVRSNAEAPMAVAKVFQDEVEWVNNVEGLQINIMFNPLTRNALRHMQKHGGNALGLSIDDGPLTGTLA